MAITLRNNTFQKTLLLSTVGVFLLFVLSFSLYQYKREKAFKVDLLHARLQMYNYQVMQTLSDSLLSPTALTSYLVLHPIDGLRFTVIDLNGRVRFDSYETSVDSLENHLTRPEIREALHTGSGFDIKRTSLVSHETYFYSATRVDTLLVRSAVPYNAALTRSLEADHTFLYYTAALTLLLGFVLYTQTSRIARHIEALRTFAMKAERGEGLDLELDRKLPDDELGAISHTLITLYYRLITAEAEKVRLKQRITQNAAHELRNPASTIHGYLESILEHPEMTEAQRLHFIERCYAQSQRMNKLLSDMSALTRLDAIETRHDRTSFTTVDLATVIDGVEETVQNALEEKHIAVEKRFERPLYVTADASLLYTIFSNLFDNALSYATGATRFTLTATPFEENGSHSYLILFSDNGVGVEPPHLAHLFERFYRVDKGRSRRLGGTGLGLSIVKNAVMAHGGTISAQPTEGGGLTIRFTLPRF